MELKKLIEAANRGYTRRERELAPGQEPICALDDFFDPATNKVNPAGEGDGLARFVVTELVETFDEKATTEEQAAEAARVIAKAIAELSDVHTELEGLGLG